MSKSTIQLIVYLVAMALAVSGPFFTMRSELTSMEARVEKLEKELKDHTIEYEKSRLEFFKHGGWGK